MNYNFDQRINRKGTGSIKYDFAKHFGKPEDSLPLWVADMDFQTAPEILTRLQQSVAHGVFGYSDNKEAYVQAVARWYQKHFQWEIQPEWLVKTPGVVFAIAAAIRAFTKEGDAVLIQPPVYYPFGNMIRENHRQLVNNPLRLLDGHYEIDFEDFEKKIVEHSVKLFILCNPHNPVGRVWKEWELRKIGELCKKYQVFVISDEIHCDFVLPGHRHQVFAALSPEYQEMTITCTAPSKTFNLAGLQVSNIFIANPSCRKQFVKAISQTGYEEINVMGLVACQAAYEEGEPWLLALKEYLEGNRTFVREYLAKYLPMIHLIEPEGTYLLWLDFRELGLTEEALESLIVEKARLWLDRGAMFGKEGEGFERINIACPRTTLEQALSQLKKAVTEQEV